MLSMVLPDKSVAPGEGKYINLLVTLVNPSDFENCPAMRSNDSPSGANALRDSLNLYHMAYEESKQFGAAVLEIVLGIKGEPEEIK